MYRSGKFVENRLKIWKNALPTVEKNKCSNKPEVKIRENFLTEHKFTSVLKSVSPWGVTVVQTKRKILTFWPSRLPENGFPEGKLTFLEKQQNEINSSKKKCQKLSTSNIFFFAAPVQPFWVRIEKKQTIFTVSKIQTMRKLNNLTTTSLTGLFFTVVRFTLLEW